MQNHFHIAEKCCLGLSFLLILLFSGGLNVTAQENKTPDEEDKRIINKVPKHLPIKVEIIYGEDKTTLAGTKFKFTNTSDKPIYYLYFALNAPDDFPRIQNSKLGFPTTLYCGIGRLGDLANVAQPGDVGIGNDESCDFQISKDEVKRFIRFLNENSITDDIRLELIFQVLSFGDKTGFVGTTGKSVPSSSPSIKISPFNNKKEISFFCRSFRRSISMYPESIHR